MSLHQPASRSRHGRFSVVTRAVAFAILSVGFALAGDSVNGQWEGSLPMGKENLRLVIHVTGSAKTGYTATMDSPDQEAQIGKMAYGMKIDTFTVEKDNINFEMKLIQAKYTGKYAAKERTITGSWSQMGSSLPLSFKKAPGEAGAHAAAAKTAAVAVPAR